MNPYILETIAGIDVVWNGERMTFICGLQIDGDGSGGNREGDPDFQPDTSLHFQGQAINSRIVPGFVLPRSLIMGVPGIVLGCQGHAFNVTNGKTCDFVVYDEGPASKLGEGSIALAEALGIDSDPRTGGTDKRIVRVSIFPGQPAIVNGVTYHLQPS